MRAGVAKGFHEYVSPLNPDSSLAENQFPMIMPEVVPVGSIPFQRQKSSFRVYCLGVQAPARAVDLDLTGVAC